MTNWNYVIYGVTLLLPTIILLLLSIYIGRGIPGVIDSGKMIVDMVYGNIPNPPPQAQQIYNNEIIALNLLKWGTMAVGIFFILKGFFGNWF